MRSWLSSTARQFESPTADERLVESTISVKRTVPNCRVEVRATEVPVTNSMMMSLISRQWGMIQAK